MRAVGQGVTFSEFVDTLEGSNLGFKTCATPALRSTTRAHSTLGLKLALACRYLKHVERCARLKIDMSKSSTRDVQNTFGDDNKVHPSSDA